ncbi:phage head morphogenesis protein [Paracoccus sp. DMF]|uniref:phage head morphogenesis protein n=1 Tax=Paracoccus sp. DMF TaxID=400837 RepID=UPI0011011726|nr:phage head morphogenesis protein [Paracoccus sp. DMF]MCV2448463.1 phage head morphogenesis protein [Paracoccus sp. DMF]
MRDYPGEIDRLLLSLEPSVRAAFTEAINRIVTTAELRRVQDYLDRRDVEGLLDALNLSPEYFRSIQDAVDAVFYAGAAYQVSIAASVSSLPFNRRHWAAETWARDNGSRLIVEIAETTRQGVREIVAAGLSSGRSTGAIARDIVGSVNRATGRREGGVVGLTGQQARSVSGARAELHALDAAYFQRKARDRRYDATVRRAIREGKPLPEKVLNRILSRYSDGLLIRRGDLIARTEAHNALNAGRYEAMRQTAEAAGVGLDAITIKWQATRDRRTRDSHRALGGKTVGYGEAFVSPLTGAAMRFPGDRSLGAPASEIVHCRCTVSYSIEV